MEEYLLRRFLSEYLPILLTKHDSYFTATKDRVVCMTTHIDSIEVDLFTLYMN
jgi:hypothetical protein